MRRGWSLGDEDFRQELLQRGEGKLGDHTSGALRPRLRQETTLSVKTIVGRMHLGTSKSTNARLHGCPFSRGGDSVLPSKARS